MRLCDSATRSEDLRHWLLYAPIQPQHGEHCGAIAGWLDENRRPAFLYGEAAGYYLTCVAQIARTGGSGAARRRLNETEQWLHSVWRDPPPATRHYPAGAGRDWRNEAVFTFDCAMMLRGLSTFDTARAGRTRRAVQEILVRAIGPDGALRSHLPRRTGGAVLPARWSTAPGPYQLKTAVAILSAPDLALPLRAAAEATANKWLDWFRDREPTGDLHPLLYHLEGLLMWGAQRGDWTRWRLAADVFGEVMEHQRPTGELPAALEDRDARSRSDVVAQALRLGCLFVAGGFCTGGRWERRLRALADALDRYVDPGGGVRFASAEGVASHLNVWCTIFAFQAFALFERREDAIDERILTAIA